jgi:hypothetical protein
LASTVLHEGFHAYEHTKGMTDEMYAANPDKYERETYRWEISNSKVFGLDKADIDEFVSRHWNPNP